MDLSLEIRQAVVAHLRGDATVTALVPAVRIYGEFATSEEYPFIRMGYATSAAFEATRWTGSEQEFTIHVFAKGPGTDALATIVKRIIASMRNFVPMNVDGAWSEWIRTETIPDPVAEVLHAIVTFEVTAFGIGD